MTKKDKLGKLRRSHKARLIVILTLLIIVLALAYFWKQFRIWLLGIAILLLAALGLEVSGTDYDIGKLIKTGSLKESRVERTKSGNFWKIGDECTQETLDCDDFEYQEDAQDYYEKCGGVENDVSGLDRDKDGIACEMLPHKK